jgi:hypothetical protein
MKKKETPRNEVNLLELVPIQNISWEKNEEGLVSLLKPKIQIPFLAKRLLHRMKRPYYKVNLDEIGSHFWEHCDGRNSIERIAALQKLKFGEKIEPVYERLGKFLKVLEHNKFVTIKQNEDPSP